MAGAPVALLRLHRLRRDRPPRRPDPAGVAGLAGRPRPPHRGAAGGLHARPAALRLRGPVRPRPEPGRHLPAAARASRWRSCIRTLMADRDVTVTAATGLEETAGPANTFLSQVGSEDSAAGHAVHRALHRRSVDDQVHLEGAGGERTAQTRPAAAASRRAAAGDVVVIASGNLAMVYLTALPRRMTLEEIAAVYPGLVPSLVAHPGVGFITVRTDQRGTVCWAATAPATWRRAGWRGRPAGGVRAVGRPGGPAPLRARPRRRPGAQQPAGPRDRRGGGLRGAGRQPRRPRRLADPGGAGAPGGVAGGRGAAAGGRRRAPPARRLAAGTWASGPPSPTRPRSRRTVRRRFDAAGSAAPPGPPGRDQVAG